jgi:predicted nucleic acid-binding protein
MKYLLDTCVISALAARQPNPVVVQWIDALDEERLYLSVITIGEIAKGVQKLPDSKRRDTLARWLQEDLLLRFRDRILPIDITTMLVWGKLAATLEKQGKPMPAVDSLIAAIALQGGLALVTRNEQNFEHSGVTVINPWKG